MRPWIPATACVSVIYAASALAADQFAATRDAVMGHMRAVGQHDLDAYVEGYAEDGKIVTTSRAYSGHEEIREFASDWFAEFSQPGATINMHSLTFEGDTAIVVFSGDTPANTYNLGVETFLVEDGRIVTQTYVVEVTPKE